MKPDARHYNPDPRYLQGLLVKAGLSRSAAARAIGMSRTGFNHYLRDESEPLYRKADYRVQFALECLAEPEDSIDSSPQGGNHCATT